MTMNNFLRVGVWTALWVVLAGSAGCKADFLNNDKAPKIANLDYIPLLAPVEEGKTTPIIGSFDITHKSGQTVSINSVAYNANGKEVSSGSIALSEDALKASDTLGFSIDMSTAKKGNYTFQVFITDAQGRQSNKLDGTFRVTDIY